jgi:hypothetical protein
VRVTPPALEAPTFQLVLIGMAAWAVAFLVLLVVHRDADWLWTCVVGFGLGIIGLPPARRGRLR